MNFLAVDDEALALTVLVKTLKKAEEGCTVEQAENPDDALAIVRGGFVPDIAFLDVEMFGMTGIELAKKIKDICHTTEIIFVTGFSKYAFDAFSIHAHGYILKPVLLKQVKEEIKSIKERMSAPAAQDLSADSGLLTIKCFGNFSASVHGEQLQFSRQKARELLAYLIDKKGTPCTTKEICAVLFGDKNYTHSLLNQTTMIISSLQKTLRDAGVGDAVSKEFNSIAIVKEKVDCDYYRFLSGDVDAVNSYTGEYMNNYEWADMTAGWLSTKAEQ